MRITRVRAVYFSPAGSTRLVATKLAGILADMLDVPLEERGITLPSAREGLNEFSSDELVVVGSPTYAGRLPNKILPFFQTGIRGSGTPAVPVVTFGNRSFQDSLSELSLTLGNSGFITVGAAAMASRHVFSDRLAYGRPNDDDLAQLAHFAASLADRIRVCENAIKVTVPGNNPPGPYYTPLGTDGQPVNFLKAKPNVKDDCTKCGKCASVCPMGSIDRGDPRQTPGICIKCQACVKCCPHGNRSFDDPGFLSHVSMLEQNYQAVKGNMFVIE